MSNPNVSNKQVIASQRLGATQETMLVVGDLARWSSEGRAVPHVSGLQYTPFETLAARLDRAGHPDVILSPLVGDSFDASDIARLLVDAGFKGHYRIISDDIPDAALISSEIRAIACGLDFDLLVLPAGFIQFPQGAQKLGPRN